MARGNPGRIVKWTNKKGDVKYGIVYNGEQSKVFSDVKKVFVRHVLEDFVTKEKDPETGKNLVGLVDIEKLEIIGHVD